MPAALTRVAARHSIAAMSVADDPDIHRAFRLCDHLPGVEIASWYGTASLKVGGKGFARIKSPGVLVVLLPLEIKELLMEQEPDIYFETDHYKGWPAFLIRLAAIDDEALRHRLEMAWLQKAPKQLAQVLSGA